MVRAELIEALTLGQPEVLEAALEALLADPDPAEDLLQLARRRLNRLGFDLDEEAFARLAPLRERFWARFGR